MKEQDLIDLGFEKITANDAVEPFYYYCWEPYGASNTSLISQASDEIKNDSWNVYMFEDEHVMFSNAEDVKVFIDVIKRNIHN